MNWTIEQLMPYGFVSAEWMRHYAQRRVPVRFRLEEQVKTPAEWRRWCLDSVITPLSESIWPRWEGGKWVGKAASGAIELTKADFDLMGDLKKHLTAPARGRNAHKASHRAFFESEDETFVGQLTDYLPELSEPALQAVKKSASSALFDFGPAPLDFKLAFQRPRAFQVARLFDLKGFDYEWAKTAITPAFISGHSLQGLLTACHVYVDQRRELERSSEAVTWLQQFAVDVGDRRVFAGVHYPSDNIGSWFTALKLSQHLFGGSGAEAHDFMVKAIADSMVFQAMNAATTAAAAPYLSALRQLDEVTEERLPGADKRKQLAAVGGGQA